MWKPSNHPLIVRPDSVTDFESVCNHYNEHYEQNVKQFRMMATMLEHLCVKFGIEGLLTKGRTTGMLNSMILVIRLSPEYKLKYGDAGFTIRDREAYKKDYSCDISITINGYEGNYTSCIGLKLRTETGIMMHEIPTFDSAKFDEKDIPAWFVDQVKEWLE